MPILRLGCVTSVIEKVSNAVGVLYEPRRIKKKAEPEAQKIKELASIELTEIQQRAIDRMVQQEGRKQENIEAITAQAAASLDETADVQNLEEDWVAHFFKNCDIVSDKEMQSLWSKLLSGESFKPGTFSKRTVDFVASMDKKDAEIFTKFCQFSWFEEDWIPLIMEPTDEIYTSSEINFSVLKPLDSIGLISFEATAGYRRMRFGKNATFSYFGRPTIIEFKKDKDNELNLGKVLLTRTGEELAPICGAQRNEKFYEYIIDKWFKAGLVLHSPLLT
ncbi:MAG: DUF2806 domain-containing protein [Candidatus Electrothrix sp. GM3_4]|nr:DUF2806 domain-containing protein [Candidatus Electrothrix sp. GM3_4]